MLQFCSDENQIFRQEEAVVLVSYIGAPLVGFCGGNAMVFVRLWLWCSFAVRVFGLYARVVAHLALHFD